MREPMTEEELEEIEVAIVKYGAGGVDWFTFKPMLQELIAEVKRCWREALRVRNEAAEALRAENAERSEQNGHK